MTILLEDSFLARDKSRVLKEYMEHLFSHRFGKEIQVGFDFTDDAKQAFYKARKMCIRDRYIRYRNRR